MVGLRSALAARTVVSEPTSSSTSSSGLMSPLTSTWWSYTTMWLALASHFSAGPRRLRDCLRCVQGRGGWSRSRWVAELGGGLGRVARRLRWGVVGGEGSGGVTGWVRAGRVYSTRAGNRRVHDAHPLEIVGLDSGVATQGQQVLVVGEEARYERVASARHHHVRRVLRVLDVPHLGHSYSARKRVKVGVRVRQHHIAWLLQPLHDAAACSVVATLSWPGRRLPDANKPEDEPKEQHDGSSRPGLARCWRRVVQMIIGERHVAADSPC